MASASALASRLPLRLLLQESRSHATSTAPCRATSAHRRLAAQRWLQQRSPLLVQRCCNSTSSSSSAAHSSSSTSAASAAVEERIPQAQHESSQGEAPPPPPKRQFSLRPFIFATFCLAIGAAGGNVVRFAVAPPESPEPGSLEDAKFMERIRDEIDKLPIVQELRAKSFARQALKTADLAQDGVKKEAAKEGEEEDGAWRELLVDSMVDTEKDITTVASSAAAPDDPTVPGVVNMTGRQRLIKESTAGARGYGVQRVFWNEATEELIVVIWFGQGTTGWPGIAHGGGIATLLKDALSRVVVGPDASIDTLSDPSSLAITYAAPTRASTYYILRASRASSKTPNATTSSPVPVEELTAPSSWFNWLSPAKDLTKRLRSSAASPTLELRGTLEDLNGKVSVRAEATWPSSALPPKP